MAENISDTKTEGETSFKLTKDHIPCKPIRLSRNQVMIHKSTNAYNQLQRITKVLNKRGEVILCALGNAVPLAKQIACKLSKQSPFIKVLFDYYLVDSEVLTYLSKGKENEKVGSIQIRIIKIIKGPGSGKITTIKFDKDPKKWKRKPR
ncbi:hypothetical protein RF11_06419 [Thelohanellus kitauei]|uniref:DNA/RNA-binding protein Alba-like domain-containing protein n=1 Tax=Thelohanellus kitauei TaxID=669202 RepID=A0A0C2J432_THEKT|nr:hypothetical protein RF11_06419 [Thelohanellus kitauei]